MLDSAILDVVIGVFFIFLVLSSIASSISAWISNILDHRAKDLEKAVIELLGSEENAKNLFESKIVSSNPPITRGISEWIKKSNLFNIKPSKYKVYSVYSKDFANAVLNIFTRKDDSLDPDTIYKAFDKIPEDFPVKKWIFSELKDPAAKLESVKKRIMEQFDKEMEKLTIQYKNNIWKILFILSLIICASLNADIFRMTNILYKDKGRASKQAYSFLPALER